MNAVVAKRLSIDAEAALETWARWSKRTLSGLGYPAINIIARIVKYGLLGAAQQVGIKITESDEVAEIVERAVMRLQETEREVVYRHYLLPDPDYISADLMGIDKRRFSEYLSDAKRSIADYLSGAVESRINVA